MLFPGGLKTKNFIVFFLAFSILLSGCAQQPPAGDAGADAQVQPGGSSTAGGVMQEGEATAGQPVPDAPEGDAGVQDTVVEEESPPTVSVVSVPSEVFAGEEFTVTWKVDSEAPAIINHTAIHFGTESRAGEFGDDVGPQQAGYSGLTPEFAATESSIPNEFSAKIAAPESAGTLYLRAHAIFNGKNYWTEEVSVAVKAAPAPEPQLREFYIEADDSGFYDEGGAKITEISASAGDTVKITFKVRTAGVYYAGLLIQSPEFDSGDLDKGEEYVAEFTAEESHSIKSYWPSTKKLKATLNVNVQ